MKNNKNKVKEIKGWDFISYGLLAFGGLGMEVLYMYCLAPLVYGPSNMEWRNWADAQIIAHWVLTCLTWGLIALYIVCDSKKKIDFDIFIKGDKVKTWQWVAVVTGIVLTVVMNYIDWDGFKIIGEYQRKGFLLFTFQHIYYLFETVLFMFIIVFAQKACEVWFKNSRIPYGGIVCGITWGFAHAFTKGSLLVGLEGILVGFLFGAAYLLLNRDIKKTYIVLVLMFIL